MRMSCVGLLFVLACGGSPSDPDNGDPVAVFTLPRTGAEPFFDLPWPNDVRRTEDGFIDVRGFRNPRGIDLLEEYVTAISTRMTGYSGSASTYLRFGTAIDESTLPQTPSAALEPDSSVFIMNVDTDSAGVGTRHPAVSHYYDPESSFWPGHALAVRPVHGLPLQSETAYAVVVTRAVKAGDGRDLEPSEDLAALLDRSLPSDPAIDAAAIIYEPALDVLAANGVPRQSILNIAVFTTQDPVADLVSARDWLVRQPPPEPVADRWRWVGDDDGYTLVHGAYPSPIFQSGELPYLDGGGEMTVDTTGEPVVYGSFDARFSITVPNGEMPATGWPVVLYAHGTGGDFESSLSVAAPLASIGIATMGVDQIHHAERNPTESGPEALTFNFINPFAFRDNARQSALDIVQQARFIANNDISDAVIAGDRIFFDADKMFFMGHSQGGINGPLFLAIDDQCQGGVLSGAGAHLPIALVEKTEPLNIPDLVRLLLRLSPTEVETEHLVYEHPVFALMQTWTDAADPNNYARMFFDRPRMGFAPKSILQTEGITDPFSPPRGIEALAVAGRIPLLEPALVPIEGLTILGMTPVSGPIVGNVGGGQATAGLIQYDGGHFVAFSERALTTISGFFGSWVNDGTPSIQP